MRSLILLVMTVLTLSRALAVPMDVPKATESSLHMTTTELKNVFVLKVNKKFIGAHLEVLAINGECITCQTVTKQKMVINLRDAEPGTYVVSIQKDGVTEKLRFVRK